MLSAINPQDEPSYENGMEQMAERLLIEFSSLPPRMVFGAIDTIRRSVRDDGSAADTEDIELLARWLLGSERVLASAGMA